MSIEFAARKRTEPQPDLGRQVLSFAALTATAAALVGVFAASPIALEALGLPYFEAGGGVLSRVHPATPLAAAALLLRCLAARSPGRTLLRLLGGSGTVLLLCATATAAVFAILVDRTPVSPLLDTFILPVLLAALLRDLDPAIARRLAFVVMVLFTLNALAAGAEVLLHWRLIPINVPENATGDPTAPDAVFSWQAELADDWRARALFGHPIAGSAVTGAFVLCLVAPACCWPSPPVRASLAALCAASLFTFGGRTALVLTFPLATALLSPSAARGLATGRRLAPRPLAIALTGLAVAAVAALLLAHAGFFERTLARFAVDEGSASTRLTMFRLLEPLTLHDLLLHPDKDQIATLQRLHGLEFGIESSWLGLVLAYGIVVASLLFVGILAFSREIVRRCGKGVSIVLGFYFILVSVTASMSGKTTTFAMVIALVLLFLRRGAPDLESRRARLV